MTEEPTPSRVGNLVTAVKTLTIGNALVIILLALVLGPLYLLATEPEILDRFLSSYQRTSSPGSACTVMRARERGEPSTFAITSGLAFDGSTRWLVGVTLSREPTSEEITGYCTALQAIVDKVRAHDQPSDYPNGGDAPR